MQAGCPQKNPPRISRCRICSRRPSRFRCRGSRQVAWLIPPERDSPWPALGLLRRRLAARFASGKRQTRKETRPWVWYDEKNIPVKIPFLRGLGGFENFGVGRPLTLGEPQPLSRPG